MLMFVSSRPQQVSGQLETSWWVCSCRSQSHIASQSKIQVRHVQHHIFWESSELNVVFMFFCFPSTDQTLWTTTWHYCCPPLSTVDYWRYIITRSLDGSLIFFNFNVTDLWCFYWWCFCLLRVWWRLWPAVMDRYQWEPPYCSENFCTWYYTTAGPNINFLQSIVI